MNALKHPTPMKRLFALSLLALGLSVARAEDIRFSEYYGPNFQPGIGRDGSLPPEVARDAIHRWNLIAISATGLDHTPLRPGEDRIFGQQLGPGRSSRAMAIIHMAIFDAINGVIGDHHCFSGELHPHGAVSVDAAIAQAAHDTLVALYSSQRLAFDALLAEDLNAIRSHPARMGGVAFGQSIAAAILASRVNDGSQLPEPHLDQWPTSNQPGHWRQDPVSLVPIALGAHWGDCRPFFLLSGDQFRVPPPPAMTSPEYTAAFNEAKNLGGDGTHTGTQRTPEQTFVSTFWAYDGTPSLCAPPRLYNQIIVTIAEQTHLNSLKLARLLALANVAMADAGFAAWDSKYHWDFWRPVGGIREADPGTGPSGLGDGNPDTLGDPTFMPLGAPASNLTGPNFTPPFPAYPSGHATFGGALFQTLRRFYGRDDIAFTFVSDEFNGTTRANDGTVRPYIPRTFSSFAQAEEENGQSRIYLGIHWSFDKTQGILQGRRVADWVYNHALQGH